MMSKLTKGPFFEELSEELLKGNDLLLEGLIPAAKAAVLAESARRANKSLLVLTGAGVEEFKLYNDLPFFSSHEIIELAAWEVLPSENIAPSPDIVGARFQALE